MESFAIILCRNTHLNILTAEICHQNIFTNIHSCINVYAYSNLKLLSNRQEAIFKQQNPCSNRKTCVPFEYGFLLKILDTGLDLFV